MMTRRFMFVVLVAVSAATTWPQVCGAQCCLSNLFAGCGSCFRTAPPAYAVAPVMAAPIAAPIPAPAPPVMVPVQQVSYVPETTYRTQYQCVPVTSYKPSCEVDPCTGCTRECMEQVTNYVQQPVNVPYTQYRAVYSTKYVQMQPGYNGGVGAAPAMPAPVPASSAATSPFAAPVQTTPQAWGAAGADVPQQLIQGSQSIAAPSLPAGSPPQTYQQQPAFQQPTFQQQPAFQQQIVPQSGTFAAPSTAVPGPQPTSPPALSPTPSLKPIPELPRTSSNGSQTTAPPASAAPWAAQQTVPQTVPPTTAPPSLTPPSQSQRQIAPQPSSPAAGGQPSGTTSGTGMPTLPGGGPGTSTGAFPRLLEPTSHTTSWQPAGPRPAAPPAMVQSDWQPAAVGPTMSPRSMTTAPAYPTAALPSRLQQ